MEDSGRHLATPVLAAHATFFFCVGCSVYVLVGALGYQQIQI
jgi:hypothetical protein